MTTKFEISCRLCTRVFEPRPWSLLANLEHIGPLRAVWFMPRPRVLSPLAIKIISSFIRSRERCEPTYPNTTFPLCLILVLIHNITSAYLSLSLKLLRFIFVSSLKQNLSLNRKLINSQVKPSNYFYYKKKLPASILVINFFL